MAIDRAELAAWLEANCPPEMRAPVGEEDICWGGRRWAFQSEAQKLWLERCAARGLTVPTWPKEYGGAGYSREDAAVLKEEMQRIHARPPLLSFGIWMLGPALLKFGSPEQRRPICRPSLAARSAGARAIPNLAPAPTSVRCAPRLRIAAIFFSSTARRSGPPTPTRRTGFSA
jgi:alkylation response protein AidB-like acyl-CoA dehydrogenase